MELVVEASCSARCARQLSMAKEVIAVLTRQRNEAKKALAISRKVSQAFHRENEKLIGERLELLSTYEYLTRTYKHGEGEG